MNPHATSNRVLRFEVCDQEGNLLSETDYIEVAATLMAGWANTGKRVQIIENKRRNQFTDRVVVAR